MHPNPTQITEEQSQWLPRKQAPCRLPQCRAEEARGPQPLHLPRCTCPHLPRLARPSYLPSNSSSRLVTFRLPSMV